MSGVYGRADERQSARTLRTAMECGIDFLDTADAYGAGRNELLLGQVLRGTDTAVIATKAGLTGRWGPSGPEVDNSPQYLRTACEGSLRRLGLEALPLYYLHRHHSGVPIEEVAGALAQLVKAGKVCQIGLCEVNEETLRRAHAVHPIAAVQAEYSFWAREVEKGVLPVCKALGVSFIASSPLGRGVLTGAGVPQHLQSSDLRRRLPRFQPEALNAARPLVDRLAAFAGKRGYTITQVALAWLLAQDVVPIPGTCRPEHVLDNAAALMITLTADDLSELEGLSSAGDVTS